jgi:DNA-binding NarL/FixJ family response regulator
MAHETVRQALRLLIDGQPDMQVIGEAGSGRLAVKETRALLPTVVVLDISMPDMGGVEAAREISATTPRVGIVALTRHSDEAYVQALLNAGASGYVLKQSASGELLNAVRAAAGGDKYLDAALANRVAGAFIARYTAGDTQPARVTDRETEVLRLAAIGHSNKEIAADLGLSVKTVEVHKANAMRKLKLRGRVDIVSYALAQGWLHDA